MSTNDLAAAMVATRARYAQQDDEEGDGPIDLRDAGEKEDEAAEQREREDAARRSRDSSLSRAQLLDYAAQRGVRLSREEQAAPMPDLRKIVLERLAGIAIG